MKKLFCYLMKLNINAFADIRTGKILAIALGCAIFVSYLSDVHSQTLNNTNLHIIDLDNAEKLESVNISSLFKNIKCIKLEDHIDGLLSSVDKLIVHNNHFFVLDKMNVKSVLVFDGDGKFVRKIGRIGRGPGEYSHFYDFTIDTDKNELIILEHGQMHFYATSGDFLRTVRLRQSDGHVSYLQYYDKLVYTSFKSSNSQTNNFLLQSVNIDDGQRKNFFLDVEEHNKGWNESFVHNMSYFVPKLAPPYLFRHSFMDTIFAITDKGLMPYITIKSKDMITKRELQIPSNSNLVMYTRHLFSGGVNKIFSIYNYFETPEYVHLQYHKGIDIPNSVFFNKNTKTTHVVQSTNFRNDLLFAEARQNVMYSQFITFGEQGAYEAYYPNSSSTEWLIKFVQENNLKPPFNELLKSLNEESNPVIFYYEFK